MGPKHIASSQGRELHASKLDSKAAAEAFCSRQNNDDSPSSVSKQESSPQTFTLFPQLAIEIRHSIFTYALNTPTLVPLIFAAQDPLGWDMHLVSRTIPPLLHTNSESRSLARKIYPVSFTIPGKNRQVYVNFEVDTVVLTSSIFPYHSEWFFETMAFRGGLEMERIKSLAININWYRTFGPKLFVRQLGWYGGLEEIILFVEEEGGMGETGFVEIDDERDGKLLWRFSSEVGENEEGVREACERTVKGIEKEYNEIVSDETHEDYEYVIGWKLPDLRVWKLVGSVEGQVLRERAEIKDWWVDRE